MPAPKLLVGAGGADGIDADEDDGGDDDDDDGAAVAAAAVLSNDEDILLCCHLTSMGWTSPIIWTVHENKTIKWKN